MSKGQTAGSSQQTEVDEVTDLRNGTSADTVATPEPDGNQTVFNTEADADHIQTLYLWEAGNVPARTEFTENMTGYFDEWDFRPYMTAIPVREVLTGCHEKGIDLE